MLIIFFSVVFFISVTYGEEQYVTVKVNITNNNASYHGFLPEGGLRKLALRYGFQQTKDCRNFEKAFRCIDKCQELGYDVAHSDKKCMCTCYRNPEKAKYTMPPFGKDKPKRHTVPTTTKPAWAVPSTPEEITVDPVTSEEDLETYRTIQEAAISKDYGNTVLTGLNATDSFSNSTASEEKSEPEVE